MQNIPSDAELMQVAQEISIDGAYKASEKALKALYEVQQLIVNMPDSNKRYAVLKLFSDASFAVAKLSVSIKKWKV